MKKLFVNGCIALMGVMLVMAFTACPQPDDTGTQASNEALLKELYATVGSDEIEAEVPTVITAAKWATFSSPEDLEGAQIGELDFNKAAPVTASFDAVVSTKAEVTYASGATKPTTFKALSETSSLTTGDYAYFKVVSESGTVTNYYCFEVKGAGTSPFTANVAITNVTIGGGTSDTPAVTTYAKDSIAELDGAMKTYTMPASALGSAASILVTRNNQFQEISWAVKLEADGAPADVDFAVFEEPASGNTLSVSVPAGLADGDKVYFKVKSGDESRTVYYGYTISAGNTASITAVTIGDESVADFGTPGTSLTAAPISGTNGGVTYDYQGESLSAYPLGITASDGGSVEYVVTVWRNNAFASTTFAVLTAATTVEIGNGSVLLIKVTSANGKNIAYYRINILLKNKADVEYGQPVIEKGVAGAAPDLDPLWDEADWLFDVSRVNIAEMTPAFRFLNTADGVYEDTGHGHTQGRAKAFWDDSGLYVYAEMTYHDFYNSATDKASNTLTPRVTALSPANVADSNIHNYDSLEIFTNERVQAYTSGDYGVQYRVAPADTTGGSRISGNNPANGLAGSVAAFRDSNEYYSWIRKDSANKELGYSIIAKIPWRAKGLTESSDVFDTAGLVKAAVSTGPKVGVEFQLNTTSTGGTRDSILTWNGIGGQSYQQCRNYGEINLILGPDGEARRSGEPGTVTFNKNSYAPGTEADPPTITVDEAGGTVGTLPTAPTLTAPWDAGVTFDGWNTRADGTGTDFTGSTSVKRNITVYAKWVFTPGTIAVDGDTLVHTLPVTATNKDDPDGGDLQGLWNNRNTVNLDGSVTFARTGANQYAGGTVRYMWPQTGLPSGQSLDDYDFVALEYIYTTAGVDEGTTAMSVLYKQGKTAVDWWTFSGGNLAVPTAPATSVTLGPNVGNNRFAIKIPGYTDGGLALQRNDNGGTIKFLKATFSKGTRYEITFDLNYSGAPANPAAITAVQGVAITDLPTPAARTGFKFTGWATSAGVVYTNSTAMPGNDLALLAGWVEQVEAADIVPNFTGMTLTTIGTPVATEILSDGSGYSWTLNNYNQTAVFTITLPSDSGTPLALANWDRISFTISGEGVDGTGDVTYKNCNVAGWPSGGTPAWVAPNGGPAAANNITTYPGSAQNILGGTSWNLVFDIDKSKVLTTTDMKGQIQLAICVNAGNTGGGRGNTKYTVTNFKIYQTP